MFTTARDPDDGDRPAYKRRRVALACRSCRSRKSRCNGASPACSVCTQLGFECVYERPSGGAVPQTRSDADSRLAAIEKALETLIQKDRASSGTDQASGLLQSFLSRHETQQSTVQSRHDVDDGDGDVHTLDAPGEDSIDGMATVASIDHREAIFFGPSSNIALLEFARGATATAWHNSGASSRQDPRLQRFIPTRPPSPTRKTSTQRKQAVNLYDLPTEQQGLDLIKTFFSDTGMLFPYVHEARVVSLFSATKRKGSKKCNLSSLCLLHTVFAFAARVSAESSTVQQASMSIKRAQALLPQLELRDAGVETVQALLLMTQFLQGTQQSNDTWSVFGLAVRTAFHLGLPSKSALDGLSPLNAEIRKRTWFGCILLDASLSMTFGRPLAIPTEYIRLPLPLNCSLNKLLPNDDSGHLVAPRSDAEETVSLFIATIELYSIQRDILGALYGSNLENEPCIEPDEIVRQTISIDRRLSEWDGHLAPHLKLKPWLPAPPFQKSVFSAVFEKLSVIMRLRYLNTQILLCRPTLAVVWRSKATGANVDLSHDSPLLARVKEQCIQSCESAAREVIEIVHQCCQNAALLGAGWFSAYYTFNATLVMYLCALLYMCAPLDHHTSSRGPSASTTTAPAPDQIHMMISKLGDAAEAIEAVSTGSSWGHKLRDTIKRLERILSALKDAVTTAETQPQQSIDASSLAQHMFSQLSTDTVQRPSPILQFDPATLQGGSSAILNPFTSNGFDAYWMADFNINDPELGLCDLIAM